MSGAGENRWRRSGPPNRQNQDARSGTNTPTNPGGRQQALSTLSGNAWGSAKGKAASGGGDRGPNQSSTPQADRHVPVKDFNAAEVKEFLKKKYVENTTNSPAVYHKVQGDSVPKRSSGAWGSRGNMSHLMPNGQDFFTQLKKQLSALDQGKTS
ncbi:hypothetical protein BU24DRAFT_417475 [Aaosphaeria arxii CBS 175.79]|uniref:Uncharacterized protein n=1 Tax=Aaosphaeria arxii CBS 175.79 TaxID=1450172 RepID=A0A6A5YAN1_9PLEO|nr:uncharacterized protein BU24DRAFT_417475 [Aaosphaeria arxii CBS 175.79]KAF2021840.1 hypothetical protein BU24DRAFT_417475 [Aaosphaeria arxii CBS 175.79]